MPTVMLEVLPPHACGHQIWLGDGDMVFSFFSTVSYRLEGPGNWGKRFPRLLLDLCDHGLVANEHLDELIAELDTVEAELRHFHISRAVYDIGDLSKPIPWELLPGAENDNLSQPWVTPRGANSYFASFKKLIPIAKRESTCLLMLLPNEEGFLDSLYDRKEKGREYWLSGTGYPPDFDLTKRLKELPKEIVEEMIKGGFKVPDDYWDD